MNVEMSRANAAATPASCMVDYVIEHATALMTLGGIESVHLQKYETGFGSRLHVSIAPFPDAPREVVDQGIVMKDAIGQILSAANIVRVVMNPSEEDREAMRKTWETSVADAKSLNAGSGQDSGIDSSRLQNITNSGKAAAK